MAGNWIADAAADIKRRGTEGICSGEKFGGPDCPPGSRRYALAVTFHKLGKRHHKQRHHDSSAASGLMHGLGLTKD